ncbi:MAG: hypothetical protein JNK79_12535 [Chitinophagaceae bacterium]|nr:hypothetical protein [Chitinophagaceae bacterium]
MKSIFYLATFILLVSCSETTPDSSGTTHTDSTGGDTTEMRIQIPNSACYQYATKSDTIFLKVEKFPNVVTGRLEYSLKEKDRNTGDIDGVMRGDTLVADYAFMSEGTRSTRQVVFLLKNNEAVEGYGKMKDDAGKMVFENIGSIDFSKGTRLPMVDCGGR